MKNLFKQLLLVFITLYTIQGYTYSDDQHQDHAYHEFEIDDWFFDGTYDGIDTTYQPNIAEVPSDAVVDEIYLRINFKSGITPEISHFKGVSCSSQTFAPEKFKVVKNEQYLIASYSFVDSENELDYSTFGSCWSVKVEGDNPIEQLDTYITYTRQLPLLCQIICAR